MSDIALAALYSALEQKGPKLLSLRLWIIDTEGHHRAPSNLLSLVPNVERLGLPDDSLLRLPFSMLPHLRRLDFSNQKCDFG